MFVGPTLRQTHPEEKDCGGKRYTGSPAVMLERHCLGRNNDSAPASLGGSWILVTVPTARAGMVL